MLFPSFVIVTRIMVLFTSIPGWVYLVRSGPRCLQFYFKILFMGGPWCFILSTCRHHEICRCFFFFTGLCLFFFFYGKLDNCHHLMCEYSPHSHSSEEILYFAKILCSICGGKICYLITRLGYLLWGLNFLHRHNIYDCLICRLVSPEILRV